MDERPHLQFLSEVVAAPASVLDQDVSACDDPTEAAAQAARVADLATEWRATNGEPDLEVKRRVEARVAEWID